jgi:hypothetical protein
MRAVAIDRQELRAAGHAPQDLELAERELVYEKIARTFAHKLTFEEY